MLYFIRREFKMNIKHDDEYLELTDEMLDKIQQNIQSIIENFDVPEDNKLDVIKKINFMYSKTKELTITDALTGLYNRRYFETTADREFSRAMRYNAPLTFAIIDIDFFKKVNDTYGHLCGDRVLQEVAYLINDSFRKTDYVFRYGGEEFTVILTETDSNSAQIPLERLRLRVEENIIKYSDQKIKVTISVGYSDNIKLAGNCVDLFEFADKALYEAKETGRNKIIKYKE